MSEDRKHYEIKQFGQMGDHEFLYAVNLGSAVGTPRGTDSPLHLIATVTPFGNDVNVVFTGKDNFKYRTRTIKGFNGGYEGSLQHGLDLWLHRHCVELVVQILLHVEDVSRAEALKQVLK